MVSGRRSVSSDPPDVLGLVAIERGHVLPGRTRQWFAQSWEAEGRSERYIGLEAEVFSRQRLVTLGGVLFFVLVCGESSFMRNTQAQNNEVLALRGQTPGCTL